MPSLYNVKALNPFIKPEDYKQYHEQYQQNYMDIAMVELNQPVELVMPVSWYKNSYEDRIFIPIKVRAILKYSDYLRQFYLYFENIAYQDRNFPYTYCCINEPHGDILPGFLKKFVPEFSQRWQNLG